MAANFIRNIQPGDGNTYNFRLTALPEISVTGFTASSGTFTADNTLGIDSLYNGLTFIMHYGVASASTTTAKLKIGSLDAKDIYTSLNTADSNLLYSGTSYIVSYDGTKFYTLGTAEANIQTDYRNVTYSAASTDIKGAGTTDGPIQLVEIGTTSASQWIRFKRIKQTDLKISADADTSTGKLYTQGNVTTNNKLVTEKYANSFIGNKFEYAVCSQASDTPQGVVWKSGSTTITGTLPASSTTRYKIYLVPHEHNVPSSGDNYDEWMTVEAGSGFAWEKIGNTDISISGVIGAIPNHTVGMTATLGDMTFSPSGTNKTGNPRGSVQFSINEGSYSSNPEIKPTASNINILLNSHSHTIPAGESGISFSGTAKWADTISANTTSSSGTKIARTISSQPSITLKEDADLYSTVEGSYGAAVQGDYMKVVGEVLTFYPGATVQNVTLPSKSATATKGSTGATITAGSIGTQYLHYNKNNVAFSMNNAEYTIPGTQETVGTQTITFNPITITGKFEHTHSYTASGTVTKPSVTFGEVRLKHSTGA